MISYIYFDHIFVDMANNGYYHITVCLSKYRQMSQVWLIKSGSDILLSQLTLSWYIPYTPFNSLLGD